MFMGRLHDGHRQPLSRSSPRHGKLVQPLTLKGCCGVSLQKGSFETLARPQGKAFPFTVFGLPNCEEVAAHAQLIRYD